MMFAVPMTELFAVVLGKDCERVTEALLREGVMEFISTSELDGQGSEELTTVEPEASLMEMSDLRRRVEGLLHTVGIVPAAPTESDLNNRVDVNFKIPSRSRLGR